MLKKLWNSIKNLFKHKKTVHEIPEESKNVNPDIPWYEEDKRASQDAKRLKDVCIDILTKEGVDIPTDLYEREKRCIWINNTREASITITKYKGKLFFIFFHEEPDGYQTHLYSANIAD